MLAKPASPQSEGLAKEVAKAWNGGERADSSDSAAESGSRALADRFRPGSVDDPPHVDREIASWAAIPACLAAVGMERLLIVEVGLEWHGLGRGGRTA